MITNLQMELFKALVSSWECGGSRCLGVVDPSAKCLSRLYLETFNRNIIVGRFPWQFRWAILLCFTSKPIQNNDLDQISLLCPLYSTFSGQTKASEVCSKEVQKMQLCGCSLIDIDCHHSLNCRTELSIKVSIFNIHILFVFLIINRLT